VVILCSCFVDHRNEDKEMEVDTSGPSQGPSTDENAKEKMAGSNGLIETTLAQDIQYIVLYTVMSTLYRVGQIKRGRSFQ